MAAKSEESETGSDDDQQTPRIRRGSALRLSVHTPLTDEAESAPPPGPAAAPERRGSALRLSVHTPLPALDDPPAPPSVADLAPASPQPLQLAHGVVAYRRAGSGPPLLLLHGWGASSRAWLQTLEALGGLRTCYALDLPGFGASPPLAITPGVAAMADVVLACADALGLERFELLGHSFGAAVAAYLAARHPKRVRSLGLTAFGVRRIAPERLVLGPLNLAMNVWRPWLTLWQPLTTTVMTLPPLDRLLASWYMDRAPADARLLRESVADMLAADPRTHLACFASLSDPALIDALEAIAAPALLVAGRDDRLVSSHEVQLAHRLIRTSRMVMLDKCGHLPMLEQPAIYHQTMQRFLSEVDARDA